MDTQTTRVTREQAGALAGVHPRTINRWSALGLITPQRGGWRDPATYDPKEVLAVARRGSRRLLETHTDSSG